MKCGSHACVWAHFTYLARLIEQFYARHDAIKVRAFCSFYRIASDMLPKNRGNEAIKLVLRTNNLEILGRNCSEARMSSFTDELSGFVKKTSKASARDRNVVAVLTVKKDVLDALVNGFSVRSIWLYMVELKRVEMGYDQFRVLVNRHIRGEVPSPTSQKGKETAATPSPELPGFKFDPVGKKEDLL